MFLLFDIALFLRVSISFILRYRRKTNNHAIDLANPLFSCTGMKFWLYMSTVILSLPKSIVFVILGTPSSENSQAAKYAKVIAILVLVVITC